MAAFDFDSLTLTEDEDAPPILDQKTVRGLWNRVRGLDQYPMEETRTRNIIMLGRSGSGKSTACAVLKDVCAVPGEKSLFSETVDPRFTSFAIDDKEKNIKYTLNVIDTPGVQEVRPRGENARSDSAILDTVKYCLKNEITKIHVLFIFAAFEQRITPLDKQAFQIYLDMFYDENVQIAFCITRAEGRGKAWREGVVADLSRDEFFGPVLERPNVHVFFCGCVEERTVRSAPNPQALFKAYNEIVNIRKKLIEFICEAREEGVSLLKLPIVASTKRQMDELFDIQFGILKKLENSKVLDGLTGPMQNEIDTFVQNISYMMENEGMFTEPQLFAKFAEMKSRMKAVSVRMDEKTRVHFTSQVIL